MSIRGQWVLSRLAASRAHQRCVAGIRMAIRRTGREIPDPRNVSPSMVGAEPLPFPVPPMLEEALGYRGALRFVAFGYNPRTRHFCHSDGGDDIPAHGEPWLSFVQHPLVVPHLVKKRFRPLYGIITKRDQPRSCPGCSWIEKSGRLTYAPGISLCSCLCW
jgi:hypothetical protein